MRCGALVADFDLRPACRRPSSRCRPRRRSRGRRSRTTASGAVGVTTTGELVLGGNLEFPGASIHHTVHGEGFVTLRSRALGLELEALAISQARPCAHCRQVLAELAWAETCGSSTRSAPMSGCGTCTRCRSRRATSARAGAPRNDGRTRGATSARTCLPTSPRALPPRRTRACPVQRRAGAGRAPPARDGRLVDGAVLESVAFNPTIGPLQDALVGVVAAGAPFDAIREAWLATVHAPRVGHEGSARDLLAAVAPRAALHVTYWASAPPGGDPCPSTSPASPATTRLSCSPARRPEPRDAHRGPVRQT